MPIYTYRNFPRKPGLTVEKSLADLEAKGLFAEIGIVVPESLMMDCIRLCCSLCLLENDPEIISPDVLADDRAKFEASGDQKFVDKAHRRGKVGWDVGKHIEVIPHFRRPHMTLVWTGSGRAVPEDRASPGQHRASGGGGEAAEWVWGRVKMRIFSLVLVVGVVGVCAGAEQVAVSTPQDKERREPKQESWTVLPVPIIKVEIKDKATEAEIKRIKGLIADLAKIENSEGGISPTLIGNAFAPVRTLLNSGMGVAPDRELKRYSAFTSLVELGPKALPLLLESLDDKTPAKIAIEKTGDFGGMWFGYPIRGNRANKHETEAWAAVKAEPYDKKAPDAVNSKGDFLSHWKYSARVGDLCFAAVGQITNRSYDVVSYQPTGCFFISSPVENKSLAAQVRAIWDSHVTGKDYWTRSCWTFAPEAMGANAFKLGQPCD